VHEDLKNFPELAADILLKPDPNDKRPVAIVAQDEGRFGRISTHRPAWAHAALRPKAPRRVVRALLYVFATVCMALGKMTALILHLANTEAMNIFLEEVSSDFCDCFVIMLLDGAGWHKVRAMRIPENIRLITQLLHSPELNPAEHLWE
jgi:putative transposase